jgi:hypothetical protein
MDPINWYLIQRERRRIHRRELAGSIIGAVVYFGMIAAWLLWLR